MILTDRVTGLPVELLIADGIAAVGASVGTPAAEPVLADAVTGLKYKVFIADGVIGWEESFGTAASVTVVDSTTSIPWLLKIVDGILSYSFAFTLTTNRSSRIAGGVVGSSIHGATIEKSSKTIASIALESRVD